MSPKRERHNCRCTSGFCATHTSALLHSCFFSSFFFFSCLLLRDVVSSFVNKATQDKNKTGSRRKKGEGAGWCTTGTATSLPPFTVLKNRNKKKRCLAAAALHPFLFFLTSPLDCREQRTGGVTAAAFLCDTGKGT